MNQADMRMQTRRPFDVEGGKMPEPNVPVGPGQFPAGGEEFPLEGGAGTERIEELAEAIIEEKWTDLMENINRIIEWKEKTESRITQLESAMRAMKDDFDKIHTSVLERVTDYDKHITDVGTEVKALEKVFQKVLPGFIENVAELSRITEDMKKGK
jgi:hypothetical protein